MANKTYRECLGLFLTGLCQVMFVAAHTYFVAHVYYLAALSTSFMVSLIWTLNVKKAAFGGWPHRLSYALGAVCGTLIGMFGVQLIMN